MKADQHRRQAPESGRGRPSRPPVSPGEGASGRRPRTLSAPTDQTPTTASAQHDLLKHRVKRAIGISTAVMGLPRPVAGAACRAAPPAQAWAADRAASGWQRPRRRPQERTARPVRCRCQSGRSLATAAFPALPSRSPTVISRTPSRRCRSPPRSTQHLARRGGSRRTRATTRRRRSRRPRRTGLTREWSRRRRRRPGWQERRRGQGGRSFRPRPRDAARPTNWAVEAPDNRTNAQIDDQSRARRKQAFCAGQQSEYDEAKTELSALVNACRRVSESGKSHRPTAPAKKKNAPAPIAARLKTREAMIIAPAVSLGSSVDAVDEGNGSEGREQREPERDILHPGDVRRRRDQEQRSDASRTEELDCHHPFHVVGPPSTRTSPAATVRTMNAGSGEQDFIHRRAPA